MSETSQPRAAGRDEILVSATDLFGEAGYDAVSINDIAQRAGASKANVFHHFGSKHNLYMEAMRRACEAFAIDTGTLDGAVDDFASRLRALLQRDHQLMREDPDRSHLILREVLECGECRGRALAGEVFAERFAELVALFRDAHATGTLRDDVPAELAATLMTACNVFLFQSQHVLRHLPGVDFVDDPERYATLVSRILLEGLTPPNAPVSKGHKT